MLRTRSAHLEGPVDHIRNRTDFREHDERFVAIESVVAEFGGVQFDKEHPLEDVVGRIKKQIRDAAFVIADMTGGTRKCSRCMTKRCVACGRDKLRCVSPT